MADESKFTLTEGDPRVGTLNPDGSVNTRPRKFMNGQPYNRAVVHATRRIGNKYCIAFPAGVPQEGEYKILPAKKSSTPTPPSAAPSATSSSGKTNKDNG